VGVHRFARLTPAKMPNNMGPLDFLVVVENGVIRNLIEKLVVSALELSPGTKCPGA